MNELVFEKELKNMLEGSGATRQMVGFVQANLPALNQATENFGKRQSQFMDNMLTLTHPTPVRNLRQILAEIRRTMDGLREAYFKNREAELEAQLEEMCAENKETINIKQQLCEVKAEHLRANIEAGKVYIAGAIRKTTNYIEQYKSILESIGAESFDEIDFEAEEEKYHIMTAFGQALCAARARNGVIDEGNHIYFFQIGINGTAAQQEIAAYLGEEGKKVKMQAHLSHKDTLEFLEEMALKYVGCSTAYALHKGQTGAISKRATLKAVK
jgi:hypothetical protein